MIYVGIDVAKDKHDVCILNEGAHIVVDNFRIANSRDGFAYLSRQLACLENVPGDVTIGMEDTGEYGDNLRNYLQRSGFCVKTINPLLTSLNKKANSLRKTKTDSIDAKQIASMLLLDVGFKPTSIVSQESEELKSLVRYKTSLIRKRAIEKTAIKRLVNIICPELEKCFTNIHAKAVYAFLREYPSLGQMQRASLQKVARILYLSSQGRYGERKAIEIKRVATRSIGKNSDAKSRELIGTLKRIEMLSDEIEELDTEIKQTLTKVNSTITTIPGLGVTSAAIILSEVGDFSRFSSAEKLLAYAGMSPSVYQSGKYTSGHARMEKRGSSMLRYAIFLATRSVCIYEPSFAQYLAKKRGEGKHYYVAISHAARKLVRLIYAMEINHTVFIRKPH